MWRRPVATILMLIITVILPLPMRAQQGIVAPTLRSAYCIGGVPTAGRRSETAATVENAPACAAMLPAVPAGAQQNQKPSAASRRQCRRVILVRQYSPPIFIR